jgi:deoxyribodipyrimidine photo-lyase
VNGSRTAIVWFRRDLRLEDNPAWAYATRASDEVAAVFVVDPVPWQRAGPARRALLIAHLRALHHELAGLGGGLHLLHGDPTIELPEFAQHLPAASVHLNADVSSYARLRDRTVQLALGPIALHTHWGNLVHPPGSVTAKSTGDVHKVFTPFHRAWRSTRRDQWPEAVRTPVVAPGTDPRWPSGVESPPTGGGATAATRALESWTDRVDDYDTTHDLMGHDEGTSHLSAHLRFGTLSARHVVDVVGDSTPGRASFVRQLAWRDWYAHLFEAEPRLARRAMKPAMDKIPWNEDTDGFEAWRAGLTGYPIVDAGMRQLAATGWMHNRARMITASFLVKDLLIDWRSGEAHFRRELIDYDLSQNAGNWQWVAGTGPDAAPYFRILNPVTQSRRHDAPGEYIRRWVPELAGLSVDAIHAPWETDPLELASGGIVLGRDYPAPIVDHADARERVLHAYPSASERG